MKLGKRKIWKDSRGMTLVEALVCILLFAICGAIMVTGFSASGSFMLKGQNLLTNGQQAAAVLNGDNNESAIGTSKASGTLSFSVGGTTVTIPGNYTTATDADGNTVLQTFEPGS